MYMYICKWKFSLQEKHGQGFTLPAAAFSSRCCTQITPKWIDLYEQHLCFLPPLHPPDLALFHCRSNARLIRSQRAGVGKSLQRNNLVEHLRVNLDIRSGEDLTIPIYKTIDTDAIITKLTIVLGEFLLRLESLSTQLLTWDHLFSTALLDSEPICVSLSHWRKNSHKMSLLTCKECSKLICLGTLRNLLVNYRTAIICICVQVTDTQRIELSIPYIWI